MIIRKFELFSIMNYVYFFEKYLLIKYIHINNQSIVAITGSTANYLNKVIFNSVILKYQNNFFEGRKSLVLF